MENRPVRPAPDTSHAAAGPWYLASGMILTLVGLAIAAAFGTGGKVLGGALATVGGVLATIGIVAVGVRIGIADWYGGPREPGAG